jgi:leader peptidase (prepilin peptidase)/N-methyltransferase
MGGYENEALYIVGALLLGAILGSFINALVYRFNTGRGMGGRSRCMQCNHTLAPQDLVPVFSFLVLRGRCRYCHSKISYQYPLVEAAAAALSLGTYLLHPEPWAYAFWLVVWMTLLFVVVYDIRHTVIPWSASILLLGLAVLSLGIQFEPGFAAFQPTTLDLLAGPILALPLFLFSLVSRGTWMGWGDSGLELSLGWLLGLTAGLTALVLAFWIGAVVGIALIWVKKGLTMKSEVPFAPFLVLGALIAHFFHVDFFTTLPLLF